MPLEFQQPTWRRAASPLNAALTSFRLTIRQAVTLKQKPHVPAPVAAPPELWTISLDSSPEPGPGMSTEYPNCGKPPVLCDYGPLEPAWRIKFNGSSTIAMVALSTVSLAPWLWLFD